MAPITTVEEYRELLDSYELVSQRLDSICDSNNGLDVYTNMRVHVLTSELQDLARTISEIRETIQLMEERKNKWQ